MIVYNCVHSFLSLQHNSLKVLIVNCSGCLAYFILLQSALIDAAASQFLLSQVAKFSVTKGQQYLSFVAAQFPSLF